MDVVVTVPKSMWRDWIAEGDLPGEPAEYESHFWIPLRKAFIVPEDVLRHVLPKRLYIVAHGRLRGYAPVIRWERRCILDPSRSCFVREGGAVAVTIPEPIRGFQGFRYRWWPDAAEIPFPDWQTEGVTS